MRKKYVFYTSKYVVLMLLLSASVQTAFASVIFPQEQQAGLARSAFVSSSGQTPAEGTYVLSNELLEAAFVCSNGRMLFGGSEALGLKADAELFAIRLGSGKEVSASAMTLTDVQLIDLEPDLSAARASLRLPGKAVEAAFTYSGLKLTWRAILRDGSHYLRTELELTATRNTTMKAVVPMRFALNDGAPLPAVVGNTRGAVLLSEHIFAGLETPMGQNTVDVSKAEMQGLWSRQTTIQTGQTWRVGAVVGLVAPGQARRSFLAYSERERAVPWRPFPLYNSWYELNIDRNNDPNYTTNFNDGQCLDVLTQWKTQLFEPYGVGIASFVWDDGWDEYGTWTFNPNFPNGFSKMSAAAEAMDSEIGAWLGPVGGYGRSGDYRRNYWSGRGGMQLSNKAYFDTFLKACTHMLTTYHFNFFKFDGISAQFSAVGPDDGATGEENAEGIIEIERRVREVRPDVFLNTTVGTWASPFWFQFTDAVWRQENDFGTIGDQGSDRERWITYRDRLVYQNFVQNSPLCPINTLMTHGFILTKYGSTASDRSYEAVLRELRCAFACGSGMVELYADYALMNSIKQGALWKDLADCIQWQRRNADVLPDVHWVGGDPWDGSRANVYGWAAWNGERVTLALRNPSASPQNYKTTLREMFDIPDYIHTRILLTPAFQQSTLPGLSSSGSIDIDRQLTIRMPASSVFVFDGTDAPDDTGVGQLGADRPNMHRQQEVYDLQGRLWRHSSQGLRVSAGQKVMMR